jgi:hypothetical protein
VILDHVACLVENAAETAKKFQAIGIPFAAPQDVDADNSRRVAVETAPAQLLLVQPRAATGAVARAARRFGFGWHHLALAGPEVDSLLPKLKRWAVCPSTPGSRKRGGPAWVVWKEMKIAVELQPGPAPSRTGPVALQHVVLGCDSKEGPAAFAELGLGPDAPLRYSGDFPGIHWVVLGHNQKTIRVDRWFLGLK